MFAKISDWVDGLFEVWDWNNNSVGAIIRSSEIGFYIASVLQLFGDFFVSLNLEFTISFDFPDFPSTGAVMDTWKNEPAFVLAIIMLIVITGGIALPALA